MTTAPPPILVLPWQDDFGDTSVLPFCRATLFLLTNQLTLYTPLKVKVLPFDKAFTCDVVTEAVLAKEAWQEIPLKQGSGIVLTATVSGAGHGLDEPPSSSLLFTLVDVVQRQILSQWRPDCDMESETSGEDAEHYTCIQQLSDGLAQWLLQYWFGLQAEGYWAVLQQQPLTNNSVVLQQLLAAENLASENHTVDQRINLYQQVLVAMPTQETALLNLARLYQTQQQYSEVLACYQQLLSSSQAQPAVKAYYANEAGICQAILKNRRGAKSHWYKAIALFPGFILPYLNLAHQLEEENDLTEAEVLFLKAQALEPADLRTTYSLARIYSKTSQWDRALKQYQQQLDTDNQDAWCYNNIANCYLQLHRSREAQLHFRKAVQLDPASEAGQYAQFVLHQLSQVEPTA